MSLSSAALHELEREGVDSVAEPGGARAVVEAMAQVGAAAGADGLEIGPDLDRARQRIPVGRPSARVVFGLRVEEGLSASGAGVDPVGDVVQVLAGVGEFRPALTACG